MGKFKVGNRVSFLNDIGGGTIRSFNGPDEAMVESEDGFEMPYPTDELVLVGHPDEEEKAYKLDNDVVGGFAEKQLMTSEKQRKEEEFERKFRHVPPMKRKKEDIIEVDLHIHQLVDEDSGLEPHQMLDIQMRHFERMVNTAIREKRDRIVFIHGVGQGVLKNEIRKALEFYPECSFRDAPFHTYGVHGATEVTIHHR